MPTVIKRDRSGSLFASLVDLFRITDKLEENPGINIGHITVYHNNYVIVLSGFRGYKEDFATHYRPSDEIWVYDQIVEKWIKKVCTAETCKQDIPLERSGATGVILDHYLYLFGGYSEEGNLNTLHRLNLFNLQWRQLSPTGIEPLPCDKNVSWQHRGKFYLFGGYGPAIRVWNDEEIRFQFIYDNSSQWHYVRGWNNQLVCYEPATNSWQWPVCTGTPPTARAACACAKTGNRVYIFGGRNSRARMNDMYVLDLDTWEWTQILENDPNNTVKGRSWHSLTPISDTLLILYGGFSHDNHPMDDCWIFNTVANTWQPVTLPFNKPRLWHTATLSSLGEILILGGAEEEFPSLLCRNSKSNNIFAKEMFTIQLQPKSLFRLCLGVVASNQLLLRRLWNELPVSLQEILQRRCMLMELMDDTRSE